MILPKDILPLLLTPSLSIPLHASHALSTIRPSNSDFPPYAQLRALTYAVRWELGIPSTDFLGDVLEGERWLVWAAGNVCAAFTPLYLLSIRASILF